MNNEVFTECFQYWSDSTGNKPFWDFLAKKHKYPSAESIRSAFKRERKNRGLSRENWRGSWDQDTNILPVVGVIDIEVLPAIGMMFQMFDVDFSEEQIISDVCFLSWAGKFLTDDRVYSDILTPVEAIERDARRITESAHDFISKCDVVIGHNFRQYDDKHLNTNFLLYDLEPVKHRVVDTLEVAKANFKFSRNKLSFINNKLGIRNKISNDGFILWKNCSYGDPEALKTMDEYNCGDILATEELFWRLQPYIQNLPNFSVFSTGNKKTSCSCGCDQLAQDGYWFTNSAVYEKMRCTRCGALMRGKKNLLSKNKRASLTVRL